MNTWLKLKDGIECIGLKVRDSPSGLAVLLKIEELDQQKVEPPVEKWIPISQILVGVYNSHTKEYRIMLPSWLANKLAEEIL